MARSALAAGAKSVISSYMLGAPPLNVQQFGPPPQQEQQQKSGGGIIKGVMNAVKDVRSIAELAAE